MAVKKPLRLGCEMTFKTILRYVFFGIFLLALWGLKKALGGR